VPGHFGGFIDLQQTAGNKARLARIATGGRPKKKPLENWL
jgi:hypothetical protein